MERKERVQVVQDGDYTRRQRVVEYVPEARQVIVSRVSKLLWLIAAVLTGIITFRFVLKLLAANPENGFVDFIYTVTDVLVAPFNSIITSPTFDNGAIIDMASLFAIIVYVLATWALVALFRILFAGTKASRRTTTIEHQS